MLSKRSLAIFSSILLLLLALSCAGGLQIKVYSLSPDEGLVRKQDNEVIPFTKAKGYYCVSPSDFEALIQAYKNCKDQK